MTDTHKLTYGEKAVGVTFNPSENPDVTKFKATYAMLIDKLDNMRSVTFDGEKRRLLSIAITEAQTAQMWAVKAVTYVEENDHEQATK
jgi:hypothetical protein